MGWDRMGPEDRRRELEAFRGSVVWRVAPDRIRREVEEELAR